MIKLKEAAQPVYDSNGILVITVSEFARRAEVINKTIWSAINSGDINRSRTAIIDNRLYIHAYEVNPYLRRHPKTKRQTMRASQLV
jgi:hypothetical protein